VDASTLIALIQIVQSMNDDAFAGLSDAAKAHSESPDKWSAKDTVAHLTTWQRRWLDWLQPVAQGRLPDDKGPGHTEADWDRINAESFAANRARPWDQVWAESQKAYAQVTAWAPLVPQDYLNAKRRLGMKEERPAWTWLAGPFLWHVEVHVAEFYSKHGEPDKAIQATRKFTDQVAAIAPTGVQGEAFYNYACILVLNGRADDAVVALGDAFTLNATMLETSKQDTDLDSLRARSDFQTLCAEAEARIAR
jgi:Protein of unknown function (DUF1706)